MLHVETVGASDEAQNWLVGSADIKNAFHQMRIPRWLQAYFAFLEALASEVGYTGKAIDKTRVVPDSLIYLVPVPLPIGLLFSRCHAGSADSPLFISHGTSAPPVPWSVSVGRTLIMLVFWLAAETARTQFSQVFFEGVKKAGLDVHDISC